MTPSELLSDPETYSFIESLAKRASSNVGRRVRSSIEDLTQEALLWCLQHPDKFMEHWNNGHYRWIVKAMENACKNYAVIEAEQAGGADKDSRFSYRGELIEELLKSIWDIDAWTNPPKAEVKSRGGDPALGNTWITTLADVKFAVEKQSPYDQWLLKCYYQYGWSQAMIASQYADHVSQQRIGRDLKRAVGRVREALGGRPPHGDPPEPGWQDYVGSRHAISNAEARAITGENYG